MSTTSTAGAEPPRRSCVPHPTCRRSTCASPCSLTPPERSRTVHARTFRSVQLPGARARDRATSGRQTRDGAPVGAGLQTRPGFGPCSRRDPPGPAAPAACDPYRSASRIGPVGAGGRLHAIHRGLIPMALTPVRAPDSVQSAGPGLPLTGVIGHGVCCWTRVSTGARPARTGSSSRDSQRRRMPGHPRVPVACHDSGQRPGRRP